jgi:hypothetical protein
MQPLGNCLVPVEVRLSWFDLSQEKSAMKISFRIPDFCLGLLSLVEASSLFK